MRVLLPLAILATVGACSLYFNTSESANNRHGHPGVDAGECGGFDDANPPCIPDAGWSIDGGSGYGVDAGGYGVDAGFGIDGGSGGCEHADAGEPGVDAAPHH